MRDSPMGALANGNTLITPVVVANTALLLIQDSVVAMSRVITILLVLALAARPGHIDCVYFAERSRSRETDRRGLQRAREKVTYRLIGSIGQDCLGPQQHQLLL